MTNEKKPLHTEGSHLCVGWREWCALPTLKIPAIKAKIDTGAQTSAIHAYDITVFKRHAVDWVRFNLHPIQANNKMIISCEAPVIDQRYIVSSNGHKEHRYVISAQLKLGPTQWEIELTLSNRDPMRFRLLLGREALKGRVVVDPGRSYLLGEMSVKQQLGFYHGK